MSRIDLTSLHGTNPAGFLAALGVLSACDRAGLDVRLGWTSGLVPHAFVEGADIGDLDALAEVLMADVAHPVHNVLLGFTPSGAHQPIDDLKPSVAEISEWAAMVQSLWDLPAAQRFSSVLAEGAIARTTNDSKPTALHFTSGQQKFVQMAAEVRGQMALAACVNALSGRWVPDESSRSMRWNNALGRAPYALAAVAPGKGTPPGVRGIEWLAVAGLGLTAVARHGHGLATQGSAQSWNDGAWRWPIWSAALRPRTARAVIGHPQFVGEGTQPSQQAMASLGVTRVLEAPIRRPSKYGEFGPTRTIASV